MALVFAKLLSLRFAHLPVLLLLSVLLGPWSSAVLAAPEILHWRTANGAKVYFVPSRELPIVDLRVVFDAGSARDAGRPGLACLTNALLTEGAGELDADAIAEGFTSLGAKLDTECARDMAVVSLRTLSDKATLGAAVALMGTVIREPTFLEPDFRRVQDHTLQLLRQYQQRPGKVASRAFYKALYGNHPYATLSRGNLDSVQTLTRDQVSDFYRRYYGAKNAVIAIVGDLDRPAAEALAQNLLGCLAECKPAPALPEPAPVQSAEKQLIPFPSAQSHVLSGQIGVRRGDPDYFPLYVGNHVLGGGGLVSRLADEVREQRGLSYSVYSHFLPMRAAGPFILGLQTRNDQRDQAIGVMQNTLRRFVEQGPTPKELEDAKLNITGGFPLRLDSNKKIVGYIAMIGFYGLPLDYLETFTAKVDAVKVEDVRDAFRRRVHPDQMVTVIVGGGD